VLAKIVSQDESLAVIEPFVLRSTKQVNKLTSLINELLDVAQIQAGKLQVKKNEFNLMEMVVECVDQCSSVDGKHQVVITGDNSLTLFADYDRIDQVLCNFLTNAFKYSPENSKVEVDFEQSTDGRIRLSVSDQGIGIPESKINHVFDRFFRAENTSQNYAGIGLGLYISSQIIKNHHGEIGIRNNPLSGVTAWFIL
jgi:signal transduction histidine kinase